MAKEDSGEPTFESLLAELEDTVRKLEQGNLGLQPSLDAYQSGVAKLKQCYAMLEAAQLKISMLSGMDSDGKPVAQELDFTEQTLEEKQASRSKRRSS